MEVDGVGAVAPDVGPCAEVPLRGGRGSAHAEDANGDELEGRPGGSVQLPPSLGVDTSHNVAVVVGDVDIVVMVVPVVHECAERSLVGRGGGSEILDDFFETLHHFVVAEHVAVVENRCERVGDIMHRERHSLPPGLVLAECVSLEVRRYSCLIHSPLLVEGEHTGVLMVGGMAIMVS